MVRVHSYEKIVDNASVTHIPLKSCASIGSNFENFEPNSIYSAIKLNNTENNAMMEEAWEALLKSYVYYKGLPVGTLAAMDPTAEALNYNQRLSLSNETSQCWWRSRDSKEFPVKNSPPPRLRETLVADFGGSAIGRVAPVDSGFWWIILLRSCTKCTHNHTLSEMPEVQRGMKLILNLFLSDGFDTFPTHLCADGCSMIDRRMGIYGYPIEIQALFYFALRCSREMLKPERDGKELIKRIDKRITALNYHIRNYYWLDFTKLNNIYRYKTEYSHTAVNKFNVIPESIPDWVFDFMPLRGGYLIGNVSPARMDFRWFLVGNCIAILSSLVTPAQATSIMDLIEERWEDLIGEMPLKIVYPALEGHVWRTVTGFDPKNTRWSYHNALIWLLAAACIKTGRPQIAKRAIELMEQRLSKDGWPEYYDGKAGSYVGKQARKYQTWSITGYLVAKL
ncbi:alkaline/neutral invertase CINV2-like [Hibiscus syriacus]|uniref:alkaline/neutral invertase CINV2-like n=1 Tax=Hibiscus syriacus TaxID=106335 RepID=UPI001921AB7D|nr:alkaline/neutral invertase CINV2-like [Hibiscus syriacus]